MTTPLTTASNPVHPFDEVFVFHNRPLREGTSLQDTARFSDDAWPLAPVTLQRQERGLVLHFEMVPARYRRVAKIVCYTLLSGDLPPGEPRPSITSIVGIFYKIRSFLTWLERRPVHPPRASPPRIAETTDADLEDFQRHLLSTFSGHQYRLSHRSAVRYLWRLRQILGEHALPFDPLLLPGWGETPRRRAAENATDRIPEHVHAPLLVWSLRFIDDFAPDILAAVDAWRPLRGPRGAASRVGVGRNTGLADDLRRYLDAHIARQQPLPGYKGKPNIRAISLELRCATMPLRRHQDQIDQAAAVVGITPYARINIPISGHLDEQPWIDGISVEPSRDNGVSALSRMLQAACYVVIAFLSGMRDSEVKHLRRGCLTVQRDDQGVPYRWKVNSLAFKGETDPNGVPATWVVGAPAARAIQVLEQVQPPEIDWLFRALHVGPGIGSAGRSGNATLTLAATNRQLNRLMKWINDYCATHGRGDGIPAVDGRTWLLTTRQFRRTLAWFIARRPGGTVAGAIAYRHLSIQMFEGYAGTSDSGFRAEVESELALARGEHLLAMIDHHQHEELVGPAAEEAARRLQQFGDQARFLGITINDERRLRRLMEREDPAIYPGRYATCIYNHSKALCRQRQTLSGYTQPDL
ncbi:hypothetical protein [Micromonospora sp. URMC 103]|uniref:hypothetical protein n=1 Tax=Micromonospora sp. URMC 103 TaxID=3423406 RepID=UPI003F1C6D04